eukprot:GHVS01064269.1.p1 GENE.GHVS01064269.1~~GHVS01064269.1.p1  ORF type:complete len:179 (+),score=34.71 GHVS01064269.1:213-749(+)
MPFTPLFRALIVPLHRRSLFVPGRFFRSFESSAPPLADSITGYSSFTTSTAAASEATSQLATAGGTAAAAGGTAAVTPTALPKSRTSFFGRKTSASLGQAITLQSPSSSPRGVRGLIGRLRSFLFGFAVSSAFCFYVLYYHVQELTHTLHLLVKDTAHRQAVLEQKLHALESAKREAS